MKQFDLHADAYDRVRNKITYPNSLFDWIGKNSSNRNRALDLGCGNGVSSFRLLEIFKNVQASDLGTALIDRARKNYPNIHFTVSHAEEYDTSESLDAVTVATAFYWMDRKTVLNHASKWLNPGGVFCAYKYDFPIAYGPLRDFIEKEVATKWSKYRDSRLTQYDDTLEIMSSHPNYQNAEKKIFPNIIDLTPSELALFFLSTSYVTKYIDQEGGKEYANWLIEQVNQIETSNSVKVNFDIHAFVAKRK
jgi:ubiquinone/menaquinone biosynthesis C-methylase UbiE